MSKRLQREVRRDVERWQVKATPAAAVAPDAVSDERVPCVLSPPVGLHVDESPGKGRGVFATRAFAKDEVVEVAPVIVLSAADEAQIDGTLLDAYIFKWGDTCAIALGWGSLYNHTWEPNLEYRKRPDAQVIEFVALRDIAIGEELTTNYTVSAPERAGLWSYLR